MAGSPRSRARNELCSVTMSGRPICRASDAAAAPSGNAVWAWMTSGYGTPTCAPAIQRSPMVFSSRSRCCTAASGPPPGLRPLGIRSRAVGTIGAGGAGDAVKSSPPWRIDAAAASTMASAILARADADPSSSMGSTETTDGRTSPPSRSASTWSATNRPATGSAIDGYQVAKTRASIGLVGIAGYGSIGTDRVSSASSPA